MKNMKSILELAIDNITMKYYSQADIEQTITYVENIYSDFFINTTVFLNSDSQRAIITKEMLCRSNEILVYDIEDEE